MSTDSYTYEPKFFDFVDTSSGKSASAFLTEFVKHVSVGSVLDIGCGRGVWLKAWFALGVVDLHGVDGVYVDRTRLHIKESDFEARDISTPFQLERKFDLVQCLEVAEHILSTKSDALIENIVTHGDLVLFSAAIPGQGGEHHVNEQPLAYWIEKFARRGYTCYDAVRPAIRNTSQIEPWYRFNALIFANDKGAERLTQDALSTRVERVSDLAALVPWHWRLRCSLLKTLPPAVIHSLAKVKHSIAR